jgi:hypothetical protein
MTSFLKQIIKKIINFFFKNKKENENNFLKLNFGQVKLLEFKKDFKKQYPINHYEFTAFSQFGEDGIIQYLINSLDIDNKFFFEIGVENYTEANTRFLLENNNWECVVLDGDKEFINSIKSSNFYWRYNLKAYHNFISVENINEVIKELSIPKNLGLLSIDIDGNDYWVWKEINQIQPSIVIIEYNARFGKDKSVTIPYDKNFSRSKNELSPIYFGCSLSALSKLGKTKGYSLIGTNLNGNNAFFVKTSLLNSENNIIEMNVEDCFNQNSFSEIRDKENNIIKYNKNEEEKILSKFPIIEV